MNESTLVSFLSLFGYWFKRVLACKTSLTELPPRVNWADMTSSSVYNLRWGSLSSFLSELCVVFWSVFRSTTTTKKRYGKLLFIILSYFYICFSSRWEYGGAMRYIFNLIAQVIIVWTAHARCLIQWTKNILIARFSQQSFYVFCICVQSIAHAWQIKTL